MELREVTERCCSHPKVFWVFSANIYMFKVNNWNSRKRCDIFSKLNIKIPERRHRRCSSVFSVNFKHMSCLFLEFLLLTLNMCLFTGFRWNKNKKKICSKDYCIIKNYFIHSFSVILGSTTKLVCLLWKLLEGLL